LSSKAEGRVLLPDNVVPQVYTLSLDVDLVGFKFDAVESVQCEVKTATDQITIHSKEISIHSTSFEDSNGKSFEAEKIIYDLKATTVTFVFGSTLPVGQGTLKLIFTGILNNQMAGFYRSAYSTVTGEKRIMASTQFEPLDARRCFPCWDEPAVKATFKITLIIPEDRHAFSNMPEERSVLLAGKRRKIQFAETPLMSTYLVAFCVGEFDFVQGSTENGVVVRVYTPPGKHEHGTFALDVAKKTLDLYDKFFGVKYPLPKLDMVAIPEFAMGAMENWGLVTYREVDLLIDNEKASIAQRKRVCTVVTHELAHQWFGNLVTMRWWDDLWLNEGFASWMQTYIADILFPEWKMWEQFTTDDQGAALRLDSLRTSHPIQVPIYHAEEVEEVFDAISYSKGACVVHMVNAVLGPEHFRAGLEHYMKKHAYGNTETYDLWNAWETVSGKPIRSLMGSWTEQMGFPVLTVEELSRTETECTLQVSQEWFLADGSLVAPEEQKTWMVPLFVLTSSNPTPQLTLFSEPKTKIVVQTSSSKDWVKLNGGQLSPVRVHYAKHQLQALGEGVRSKQLSPVDRASLLNDAFALSKANRVSLPDVVQLLEFFKEEDSFTVWCVINDIIIAISKLLTSQSQELRDSFSAFVVRFVSVLYERVGWNERPADGPSGKMLRAIALKLMLRFSPKDKTSALGTEAVTRFNAFVARQPDAHLGLPADYRVEVLRFVNAAGGEDEYNKLLSVYESATDDVERRQIYASLGSTNLDHLVQKNFQLGTHKHQAAGHLCAIFRCQRNRCQASAARMELFQDQL